jgi:predicted AAA+ superfamily ATPase
VRFVLLGSSQIMLVKGIRESLAGRAAIQEIFPLTLPELISTSWSDKARPSRLVRWLSADLREDPSAFLDGPVLMAEHYGVAKARWEYFLAWGALPPKRRICS